MIDVYNDQLEQIREKHEKEMQKKYERNDELIKYIFGVTAEGKELLELWKRSLMMIPDVQSGMDMLGIGIAAGKKDFIRSIITISERKQNE